MTNRGFALYIERSAVLKQRVEAIKLESSRAKAANLYSRNWGTDLLEVFS
jgi:hypothetical protein